MSKTTKKTKKTTRAVAAGKKKPKRKCQGIAKSTGKPCGANPLKPGTVIEEVKVKGKHCRRHDPDLPESARFGSHAQARAAGRLGGRPRSEKPTDVMKRLVEKHVQVVMGPHFQTLGYEVVRNAESGELELIANSSLRARIYGESKEGTIRMTEYDDLGAMMGAAEKLLDRIYGRPKQSTELTGADGGPVTFADLAGKAGTGGGN